MTAPRPATPESEPCVAVTEGYFCTLAASHEGDHIAHGFDGSVRYRWPAVTPEREPPSKWRFQDGKVIPMMEPCPNPDCIGPGCAVCKQVTVTFSPATPSEPPPHEHRCEKCWTATEKGLGLHAGDCVCDCGAVCKWRERSWTNPLPLSESEPPTKCMNCQQDAETRDSLHRLAEDVSGRLGVIEVRLVGVDGENGACGDIRDIKVRLRDIEERTGPSDRRSKPRIVEVKNDRRRKAT